MTCPCDDQQESWNYGTVTAIFRKDRTAMRLLASGHLADAGEFDR